MLVIQNMIGSKAKRGRGAIRLAFVTLMVGAVSRAIVLSFLSRSLIKEERVIGGSHLSNAGRFGQSILPITYNSKILLYLKKLQAPRACSRLNFYTRWCLSHRDELRFVAMGQSSFNILCSVCSTWKSCIGRLCPHLMQILYKDHFARTRREYLFLIPTIDIMTLEDWWRTCTCVVISADKIFLMFPKMSEPNMLLLVKDELKKWRKQLSVVPWFSWWWITWFRWW